MLIKRQISCGNFLGRIETTIEYLQVYGIPRCFSTSIYDVKVWSRLFLLRALVIQLVPTFLTIIHLFDPNPNPRAERAFIQPFVKGISLCSMHL